MRFLTYAAFLAATLALVPLCALTEDKHDHDHDHAHEAEENFDAHLAEKDGLRILHPWAVVEADGLRIYMEVENQRDSEVVLKGGESHDGADLLLVATRPGTNDSDAIDEIPIAAGADMEFAPGELYLVFSPALDVAVGDMVEAHLELEPLGELDIEIEVFPSGSRRHPHAGHNH